MFSYFYYGPAPDGRHFCYAKAPTFQCPVAMDAAELRTPEPEPTAGLQVRAAAELLGVDARWLAARVASSSYHDRARVGGKLTDRCTCGARMERLGFAVWTERPRTKAELAEPGAQISSRLFGTDSATHVQDGPRAYQDTKRDAQEWARRQLQHAKGKG